MKDAGRLIIDSGLATLELLHYIEQCYPVTDFPPSDHPSWYQWAICMFVDPELDESFYGSLDLKPALDRGTIVDSGTGRIRVDLEAAPARFLGKRFPNLAQLMYVRALAIPELITFG